MATILREIYEVLDCFSTATHTQMCNDLLVQLNSKGKEKNTGRHNLAHYFAEALKVNKKIDHIECAFIPVSRKHKAGRNPVAGVMAKASTLTVATSPDTAYGFTFLQREVPHLRALTKAEQHGKAWIDYVARSGCKPILGEIKWKADKNPFYAFIQLLTYLSELATPNQIARSLRHELFGTPLSSISAFDLHILLANFNDRGDKGKLIERTRELATGFKNRLQNDHPDAAKVLGRVLCMSGHIADGADHFSEIRCLWMV